MNALLDTHVVIWWLEGSVRIGPRAAASLRQATQLWLSAASVWEVAIKYRLGRLPLSDSPERWVNTLFAEWGVRPLPISASHALAAGALPLHHPDPFDRMLIAQAQCEGLTLVTADPRLRAYDIRTVDATV